VSAPKLAVVPVPDDHVKRRKALDHFSAICGLPKIDRIVQRGREATDAQYTIHLDDSREIRVGTIKVLWSKTEMSKVLAVAIKRPIPPDLDDADWATIRTRLIDQAIQVDETPGEAFCDTVRDWLGSYCEGAGTDRDGAMRARRPFVADDNIHVHAVSLARDIRRQYSASIKEKELLVALSDLGFVRRAIMYNAGTKRTSASYYVAPLDALNPGDVL
jgi:hypothetical protein